MYPSPRLSSTSKSCLWICTDLVFRASKRVKAGGEVRGMKPGWKSIYARREAGASTSSIASSNAGNKTEASAGEFNKDESEEALETARSAKSVGRNKGKAEKVCT